MKRVALVAHWDWVIYNFRLPLARHLQNCGIEIIFVCPFGKYVPKLRKAGFKCIHWKIHRRSISPLKELLAVWRLLHIYRTEQFDAVHHFTIKPNLYGSFVARMAKIPLVINTFTGLGYLFAENRLVALLRFFVLPVLRSALHRSNVVTIFQNKGDRDNFVQLRLVPKKQTRIIMSTGVNVSIFRSCGE